MTDGVLDLAADVLEQAGAHPHRLVVRQHGQVVGRRRWAPWSPDVASLVYSCSKTFTSAAVGIAVERGAFGYDDTLAQLWPHSLHCQHRTNSKIHYGSQCPVHVDRSLRGAAPGTNIGVPPSA